jgi:hypothetical protein
MPTRIWVVYSFLQSSMRVRPVRALAYLLSLEAEGQSHLGLDLPESHGSAFLG